MSSNCNKCLICPPFCFSVKRQYLCTGGTNKNTDARIAQEARNQSLHQSSIRIRCFGCLKMRIFVAKIIQYSILRHGLARGRAFAGFGGVFVCRSFSQDFTHDFADDHSESDEILTGLRQKHHYHGLSEKTKKTNNVMVIEPDFKWGKNR